MIASRAMMIAPKLWMFCPSAPVAVLSSATDFV